MSPIRALSAAAGLMGLVLLAGSCGPRAAEAPPIQRGTALPPPGVTMTPAR